MGIIILIIIIIIVISHNIKAKNNASSGKYDIYRDSIDKAMDHLENNPDELDVEDIYWLDDMLGDD